MGIRVLRTYLHGSLLATGARGAVLADILFAPDSAGSVSGQQSAVLAGLQAASSGALAIAAASAITFGAMSGEAAGAVGASGISGQSAATMAGMQATAAGTASTAGQGAATLAISGASDGSALASGSGSAVLGVLAASGGSVAVAGTSASPMGVQGAVDASVAVSAASAVGFAPVVSEATGSTQGVAVGAGAAVFEPMAGGAVGGALISATGSAQFANLQAACTGACIGAGGTDQHLGHLVESAGTVDLLGEGAAVLALGGESGGSLLVEGGAAAEFASLQATARGVVGAIELPPPPADLTRQPYRKVDARKRVAAILMEPRKTSAMSARRMSVVFMEARQYNTRGEDEMLSTKDPSEVVPITFTFRKFSQTDALESATVTAKDSLGDPIPGALPSLPVVQGMTATQLVAGGQELSTMHLECLGKYKSGAEILIRAALNIGREAEQPGEAVPNQR